MFTVYVEDPAKATGIDILLFSHSGAGIDT
jgi:hypothetical protein